MNTLAQAGAAPDIKLPKVPDGAKDLSFLNKQPCEEALGKVVAVVRAVAQANSVDMAAAATMVKITQDMNPRFVEEMSATLQQRSAHYAEERGAQPQGSMPARRPPGMGRRGK